MPNTYYLPGLTNYRKPPTDPQSLGVNIGKPYLPNSIPNSVNQSPTGGLTTEGVIGGLIGGGASGVSGSTPNNYSLDPSAIGKSTLSGFMNGGPIGAAAGAVTSVAGQVSSIKNKLNNTQTNFNSTGYDANGSPMYQSQTFYDANNTMNGLDKGSKSASAWIDPSAKFAFSKKKRQVKAGIESSQKEYNKASADYTQKQNNMEDYNERINPYNRMYNLYATR